jgi:hypothetical protein
MNRSRNIFVGLGTALITFGLLTLAFGQRHSHWGGDRFGYNGQNHGHYENCYMQHHDQSDSTGGNGLYRSP